MKKITTIILFLFYTFQVFSQNWITKEVENNIFVDFPYEPKYKANSTEEMIRHSYISEINGCLFIATINKNVIPFQKFSKIKFNSKTNKIMAKSFLDDYINGIKSFNNTEFNDISISKGNIDGRKFTTSMINPLNGQMQLTNVVIYYIPQRNLFTEFRTLCEESKEEETQFFNSIKFITK